MIRGWNFLFLTIVVSVGVVGCGKSSRPKMALYPVSGKLTVAGKPGQDLFVTLLPNQALADRRCIPGGLVGADGSFTIQTYEPDDGAPAGEYSVRVSAPSQGSPSFKNVGSDVRQVLKKYESADAGKRTSAAKPIAEVVVKEGDNVLDPINVE